MLSRFLCLMMVLVFAAGCGIKAQTYVMTKDRVGIEKGNGNAGYLTGTPQYIEPVKKTRKIYVLELTKAIPEKEVKKIEQEVRTTTQTNVETSVPAFREETSVKHGSNKIVIPPIDDEKSAAKEITVGKNSVGPTEATSYTVQKDDTLQKIAKKYYGTYSAWLKIYNANKEKIKNPNVVRPGIVLTLPAVK